MKRGKGKFFRKNNWGNIYVSKDVANDSAFPFDHKDDLMITITDGELKIRKEMK